MKDKLTRCDTCDELDVCIKNCNVQDVTIRTDIMRHYIPNYDYNCDRYEKTLKPKRHCVNCRHNIRKKDEKGNIYCECEIDGSYISYVQSFEGWCRHWSKDKERVYE